MAGYIGTQPVPQATQTRDVFTATAGQTVFNTQGYTPGYVDVYLNGIHLVPVDDYQSSDGTTIVLEEGAQAGDVLEVVAWSTFESAQGTGGAGATGGGTDEVFYENDTTITANYTITSGKNAGTFGPVTIADGVTVTIPDGSTWTVI